MGSIPVGTTNLHFGAFGGGSSKEFDGEKKDFGAPASRGCHAACNLAAPS